MAGAQDSGGSSSQQQTRAHLTGLNNEHPAANHINLASSGQPHSSTATTNTRPLILITDSNEHRRSPDAIQLKERQVSSSIQRAQEPPIERGHCTSEEEPDQEEEQVEEVDGIKYRIVAAVTKPPVGRAPARRRQTPLNSSVSSGAGSNSGQHQQLQNQSSNPVILEQENETSEPLEEDAQQQQQHHSSQATRNSGNNNNPAGSGGVQKRLNSVRRKSLALVSSLLQNSFLGPQSASSYEIGQNQGGPARPRRLSIYEMTKSPPPETSLEMYLSERRRSSTVSSKQVQQQLEQQSTFETNYCQRQQYFKDLNQKLINHDKKLLNVVANRGQIHRHSVDIAQLPLHLAQAKASKSNKAKQAAAAAAAASAAPTVADSQQAQGPVVGGGGGKSPLSVLKSRVAGPAGSNGIVAKSKGRLNPDAINQSHLNSEHAEEEQQQQSEEEEKQVATVSSSWRLQPHKGPRSLLDKRGSASSSRGDRHANEKTRIVIRKFQKLDESQLSSTPAPDVKIGQRVAYKEYYGNEFGTIRWIGRVPQICPDWTAGVEFDNAIGEGDGSLNGRRYFIAKDCFAKFLPLSEVAFVDQHVGRPEPGTMISVMSAAARPGQMISIQRVSTVHVQHCFLNAPHQIPGADILAVNTRLHCQCPNCGPCAHVIKPPRTQRLARSKKNATHMCQFSTYTCCGMESQEEAMCTYTGNKATSSLPPPVFRSNSTAGLPPIGNSWIEGAGYLTNLQTQQTKSITDEYKMGILPEDLVSPNSRRHLNRSSSQKRGSGGKHHHHHRHKANKQSDVATSTSMQYQQSKQPPTPAYSATPSPIDYAPANLQEAPENQFNTNNEPEDEADQILFPRNSSNIQNPPSYSPNPDYVDFNNCQTFPPAPAACPKKPITPYEEPVWCESIPKVSAPATTSKVGAAKVVYRDSIENRYLFPTDDPIDSTLEADLENLSQARYGHSTNSRLNGSKNIFKSLRSLVSCLSAQSNHSEIMEKRSENTLIFSEYGDKGNNSKAMPDLLTTNSKPILDDFLVQSNSNFKDEKEGLMAQENQLQANCNNTNNDSGCPTYDNHHHYPMNHDPAEIPYQQRSIMRHISSSSDCGFSSASQNSINFQSYQAYSPQISAEERQKRNQIYKNFLSNLMSSTTMNEEDLDRLRRVLFEPHFDKCCLHNSINQMSLGTFDSSDKADQILADKLKNSSLLYDNGFEQIQRASSANHFTNNCFLPESIKVCRKSGNGDDDVSPKHVNKSHQRSLIDGSITSESVTISSNDSFCAAAVVGGDYQSTPPNTDTGKSILETE